MLWVVVSLSRVQFFVSFQGMDTQVGSHMVPGQSRCLCVLQRKRKLSCCRFLDFFFWRWVAKWCLSYCPHHMPADFCRLRCRQESVLIFCRALRSMSAQDCGVGSCCVQRRSLSLVLLRTPLSRVDSGAAVFWRSPRQFWKFIFFCNNGALGCSKITQICVRAGLGVALSS